MKFDQFGLCLQLLLTKALFWVQSTENIGMIKQKKLESWENNIIYRGIWKCQEIENVVWMMLQGAIHDYTGYTVNVYI